MDLPLERTVGITSRRIASAARRVVFHGSPRGACPNIFERRHRSGWGWRLMRGRSVRRFRGREAGRSPRGGPDDFHLRCNQSGLFELDPSPLPVRERCPLRPPRQGLGHKAAPFALGQLGPHAVQLAGLARIKGAEGPPSGNRPREKKHEPFNGRRDVLLNRYLRVGNFLKKKKNR